MQELKSKLNVEPVGTKFGAISERNPAHFGRFLGSDGPRPAIVEAWPRQELIFGGFGAKIEPS